MKDFLNKIFESNKPPPFFKKGFLDNVQRKILPVCLNSVRMLILFFIINTYNIEYCIDYYILKLNIYLA